MFKAKHMEENENKKGKGKGKSSKKGSNPFKNAAELLKKK